MGCRAVEEPVSCLLEDQVWFQVNFRSHITSFCSLKKTHRTKSQVTINNAVFFHHNIA